MLLSDAGAAQAPLPKDAGERTIAWLDKMRFASGDLSTAHIRDRMQRVMQSHAAVFRTQDSLKEGKSSPGLFTSVWCSIRLRSQGKRRNSSNSTKGH